jgi:hypothetical protein
LSQQALNAVKVLASSVLGRLTAVLTLHSSKQSADTPFRLPTQVAPGAKQSHQLEPATWDEVASGLNIKCRKTVRKLVNDGYLKRVPGVRQLLVIRASYEEYVRGRVCAAGER